eukprot:1161471-Pelagomonas_calceolata.AAC.11
MAGRSGWAFADPEAQNQQLAAGKSDHKYTSDLKTAEPLQSILRCFEGDSKVSLQDQPASAISSRQK